MLKKIRDDVILGEGAMVSDFVNLYGCTIGDRTKIGPFVEIQKSVRIGADCKISSHTFVCEGVEIKDGVFVGHNVTFINDNYPRATTEEGKLAEDLDWQDRFKKTLVKRGASIGSSATVLGGVVIGEGAIVGAGSVVTKNVPPHTIVAGVPARVLRISRHEDRFYNRFGIVGCE